MEIEYTNKKEGKILILFGKEFIKNNKNNCKIIIDNKEQKIIEYLNVNENEKILKINLKEIKTITKYELYVFFCIFLPSLPDISKWNMNNVNNMRNIFCG